MIAAIISEFNPFHNGHAYLIETVRRQAKPRAVVCVMSGNFVQRGEAACADKFSRAAMALRGGADLIIELPAYSAVNSANEFAFGAMRTLGEFGLATDLFFGSETGDLQGLSELAEQLSEESPEFSEAIGEELAKGKTYPAAYAAAAKAVKSPEIADLSGFYGTNDILNVEYLKQLKKGDFKLRPHAIKRCEYGEKGGWAVMSASDIRRWLKAGGDISALVPGSTLEELKGAPPIAELETRFFDLLKYELSKEKRGEASCTLCVSEGLENVLYKAVIRAESLEEFFSTAKSRRYTMARIKRITVNLILGAGKEGYELYASERPYCKVLAFNSTGADLIKEARKRGAFIVENPNKQEEIRLNCPEGLRHDMQASKIYGILAGKNLYDSSDSVNIPKLCF